MTDFKVTDEAVEAGVDAAMGVSDDRLARHKVVRSIIEAALPVMFERAGFLYGLGFYRQPEDESYIPVYRIKEPK